MRVTIPHPRNPDFETIGSPIKLSDTPVTYDTPPPMLGEHTAAVLKRMAGVDAETLAALTTAGIVAVPTDPMA